MEKLLNDVDHGWDLPFFCTDHHEKGFKLFNQKLVPNKLSLGAPIEAKSPTKVNKSRLIELKGLTQNKLSLLNERPLRIVRLKNNIKGQKNGNRVSSKA